MIYTKQALLCLPTLFAVVININIAFAANNELTQLNQNIDGNVERFEISARSKYVVYNEFDNSGNLNRFSIGISGKSTPVQIASDLSDRGADFWIHEENFTVLNRHLDSGGVDTSILSILGDGSSPPSFLSTFSPSLPSTELENIGNISLSSDDPMLLFSTRASGMFTIPIDGSQFAINLSPNLDSTFSVDRFRPTRDRQNIVFSVDRAGVDSQQVFLVPSDGSAEPRLLTELPPFADMDNTRLTSLDDSRLIYISEIFFIDDAGERHYELQLFSLALDGNSAPIALSDPIIGGTSRINPNSSPLDMSFQLSLDGSSVVYTTNSEETSRSQFESQLFITRIDGSTNPVLLDTASEIFDFQLSASQEKVFYSRRQEANGNIDIATVDISGSPNPISISNAQIANDSPSFNNSVNTDVDFALSEDGLSVFFITQDQTGSHLFRSPSDGSCIRSQLSSNPLNSTGTTVNNFQIINNDQTAIYSADLNTIGINQLFSVETHIKECITQNSTSSQEVNKSIELSPTEVGNIIEFDTSNNENHIVFTSQTLEQANQGRLSNLYSINLIDEPLCFPIKAKNGDFITICL